jgi:hypothetical protein
MGNEQVKSTSSDGPAACKQQPLAAAGQQEILTIQRSWKIASVIAAILILLALLGIALTTTSNSAAPPYWISLVPIFGVLCVATAWSRTRNATGLGREEIGRQILHWLGVAVAIGLDFLIRNTGEETGQAAGLNAMLLLALGCYSAGIHLEWHFIIVGLLLSVAMIIVAKAEQYIWLIFVVGILALAALFGLRWLLLRMHNPVRTTPAAAPSPTANS